MWPQAAERRQLHLVALPTQTLDLLLPSFSLLRSVHVLDRLDRASFPVAEAAESAPRGSLRRLATPPPPTEASCRLQLLFSASIRFDESPSLAYIPLTTLQNLRFSVLSEPPD